MHATSYYLYNLYKKIYLLLCKVGKHFGGYEAVSSFYFSYFILATFYFIKKIFAYIYIYIDSQSLCYILVY